MATVHSNIVFILFCPLCVPHEPSLPQELNFIVQAWRMFQCIVLACNSLQRTGPCELNYIITLLFKMLKMY